MTHFLDIFLTIALTSIVALAGWTLRKVMQQGEHLAVIRQQLTPDDAPALRTAVNGHEIRISLNESEIRHLKEALA